MQNIYPSFHKNPKKGVEKSGGSSQTLKYQAPTKNETSPKAPENKEFIPPAPIVINASTWDGKSYKPVGKLGRVKQYVKRPFIKIDNIFKETFVG